MTIRSLITVILVLALTEAHASLGRADRRVSDEEARERAIVRALETLIREKVIVPDRDTGKLEVRQDIIEKLEAEGLLERAYAENGSFCI
ncbi:MAG: hypothetical protein AB7G93_00880 [Bdellovibrionales bacterium]